MTDETPKPPSHLPALNDSSKMLFGKYRGVVLGKVPADYLLWMGDNISPTDEWRTRLLEYIAVNRKALEQEVERDR